MSDNCETYAPAWVHAVLPEEIVRQRAAGWPDFHPEEFCHRCGRRNPPWSTDQREWLVATEQRPRQELEILCPSCFVALCEQNGGRKQGHLWIVTQVDFRDEERVSESAHVVSGVQS
jgi:hypothetical protein